jgi:hypothetical protein
MKGNLLFVTLLCPFLAAEARAAEVAVMPVQGVNLSEGDCDAFGVLFANAFARDARVAVASPLETKALRGGGKTPTAIAAQLGAVRYVELNALRLGQRVNIGGAMYARDGAMLFRADTSAASLDAMDFAISTLAHALAWRQPIPRGPSMEGYPASQESAYEVPVLPEPLPDPTVARGAYGAKVAVAMPMSSGKTFSPVLSIAFNGRHGPRDYFLEFGAGLMIPSNNEYGSSGIRVTSGFVELGGSYFLWAGSAALYIGGGISPAIWSLEFATDSHTSATCGAYAQSGVTVTRDSRFKLYFEVRLTQLLLAVANPVSDGSLYGSTLGNTYRPMLLALQGGVGW